MKTETNNIDRFTFKYILSLLPRQYMKMYNSTIVNIVEVQNHTIVLERLSKFEKVGSGVVVKDRVEVLNAQKKVRDWKLNQLLS